MADWQKGDLALCVKEGSWSDYKIALHVGQVHEVINVLGRDQIELVGPEGQSCFLEFAAWSPTYTFGESYFRKITPPKADEFDREVIDLMAGKKVPA